MVTTDDPFASVCARRLYEKHFQRHGGVFLFPDASGVFLNMGNDPALAESVLSTIEEESFLEFDFHGAGRNDADGYTWVMLVEGAVGQSDRLLDLLILGVLKVRPNYPLFQFGIIRE